ncbi:hypothetical protein TcasGA2_TC003424 [Tribolium castaneum]|uniref:Uncharacterized protein n=1 Tax=Tribolium castaneum TaxID=7070 RepID=D6WGG9_TRICA|nr:hypothetical protein TcasGA2_TC003424 [Tribolium castaneum]
MSPIENVVPNLVDNSTNRDVELRKQDRSRDLFGVQLEVTSLLLEAERRKLSVLQKELQVALEEGGSIKAKEHQKQELLVAITRIQAQHDHLDKEYREHALGALLSANTRGLGKVSEVIKMQECSKPEKPKIIGPKPSIPSKPKIVPPVNVRGQRVVKGNERCLVSDSRRASLSEHKPKEIPKEVSRSLSQTEKREVFSTRTSQSLHPKSASVETNVKYDEYSATYISEKCDTHTSFEAYKKIEEVTQKAPNSPSTVCCSILSNVTTDCCGIINVNKKELNGKTMTKIDSLDSNSSDSGGFKDFIQLDLVKAEPQVPCHQRKASQPEFLADKAFGHQRKASQPDHLAPFAHNKQTFVANAQALAQFLPQTEQKLLQHRPDDSFRQQIAKFSAVQKTDDTKARPIPQIISQSQFQQSTRKLEELLSQRLEKDKVIRKGQNCLLDGESSSQDVEQKMMVQKQMQQKLQADLQQTVKQIQEIQSIELRLPQNRKWSESNRSQPAIGLKHTPKSRVSHPIISFPNSQRSQNDSKRKSLSDSISAGRVCTIAMAATVQNDSFRQFHGVCRNVRT